MAAFGLLTAQPATGQLNQMGPQSMARTHEGILNFARGGMSAKRVPHATQLSLAASMAPPPPHTLWIKNSLLHNLGRPVAGGGFSKNILHRA